MLVDDELLNQASQDEGDSDPSDRVADFNQQKNEAKKKKQAKEKKKKKKSLVKKKLNPIALTLAGFLRSSWINMINFFFLPIIWVDIHWLANYLGSKKMFVGLGREWFARRAGAQDKKKVEKLGKPFQLPEEIGCACINFGCLFLLIATLIIIAIAFCSINPAACTIIVLKELLDNAWEIVKNFFN